MNGKDALLPFTTDDEARGSLDVILSGGGVTLSSLLLMPSFHNNNNSYQPLSLQPEAAAFNNSLLVGPKLEPPSLCFLPPTHASNQLRSLETHSSAAPSSSHKRPRQNHINQLVVPSSAIARQRRIRMSDKTQCLQKLIPLERQMDTATLYDETYKYIKFLEAQITALLSMPVQAPPSPLLMSTASSTITREQQLDGLGRLNRQQLLQVMMHSQVAQTVMYTNGWCVLSAEQLASLQQHHQHDQLVEQRFL